MMRTGRTFYRLCWSYRRYAEESANGRSSVTTKEQILIREIKNVGTDRAGADEGMDFMM